MDLSRIRKMICVAIFLFSGTTVLRGIDGNDVENSIPVTLTGTVRKDFVPETVSHQDIGAAAERYTSTQAPDDNVEIHSSNARCEGRDGVKEDGNCEDTIESVMSTLESCSINDPVSSASDTSEADKKDMAHQGTSSTVPGTDDYSTTTTIPLDSQAGLVPDLTLLSQLIPEVVIYQTIVQTFFPEADAAGVQELLNDLVEPASQTKCKLDILRTLHGMRNREDWAIQLLDSWGKPGPSLLEDRLNTVGNYHQCRAVRAPPMTGQDGEYQGNYCTVILHRLGQRTESKTLRLDLGTYSIGTCVPGTCSQEEITDLVNKVLSVLTPSTNLTALATECKSDETDISKSTILAIIVLTIIGILMILGTFYDLIFIQWLNWTAAGDTQTRTGEKSDEGRKAVDQNCKARIPYPSRFTGKLLLSFSVYTNGSRLFSTAQSQGALPAMHGIRVLSTIWIIVFHIHIANPLLFANGRDFFSAVRNRYAFDIISNAFLSVDTFFAMSGLLTAYGCYTKMTEKGLKNDWIHFVFHRYWRLTPPYMLVVLTSLGLQRFMGSGPMWATNQPIDRALCEQYWVYNLLYINNLKDPFRACLGQSWSLSADMQFYLTSPLILLPLCSNLYFGLGVSLAVLLTSWTLCAVRSINGEWVANYFAMSAQHRWFDHHDYFQNYYFAYSTRIGPYIIGLLAGYWLAKSKKKMNMSWFLVMIGWLVAIATMIVIIFGIHADLGENPLDFRVAALYNTLARTAWGVCISWVIIACVTGHGGPINSLLSWSPFAVLSKLTYMMYLIHFIVIFTYYGNNYQLIHWTGATMLVMNLGLLCLIVLTSSVLYLAFEAPMSAMERLWSGRK